jgi:hypothetical protein
MTGAAESRLIYPSALDGHGDGFHTLDQGGIPGEQLAAGPVKFRSEIFGILLGKGRDI